MASYPRKGFALLITIVLVAFLVLILVGLASFTRVETQVASNSQQIAQARQNALAALNIALGELQRTAGPDQRVTARADILGNTDASKTYWTGVWNSTVANPQPTWLVSSATPATPPTNVGAAPTLANDTTYFNANNVRLVGATTAGTLATNPNSHIIVPLTTLNAAGLPGRAAGDPPIPIGRIGWWVGDEGVKARANLSDPFAPAVNDPYTSAGGTYTPTPEESNYRLLTAQRMGIEGLNTAFSDFEPSSSTPSADSDKFRAELLRVLTPASLAYLKIGAAAPLTINEAKLAFHDASVYSRSVLSDTKNGGLQQDLTWHFDPTIGNLSLSGGILSDTPSIPTAENPTWDVLRSFSQLSTQATPLPTRAHTLTQHGVGPVLLQARFYYSIRLTGQLPTLQPPPYDIGLKLRPWFVLANPYDVAITGSYVVKADFPNSGHSITFNDGTDKPLAVTGPAWDSLSFRVSNFTFAPGAAYLFMLQTDNQNYSANGVYEMVADPAPDFGIIYTRSQTTTATTGNVFQQGTGELSMELINAANNEVLQRFRRGGLGAAGAEIDQVNFSSNTNKLNASAASIPTGWIRLGGHTFSQIDMVNKLDMVGAGGPLNVVRTFNWRAPVRDRLGSVFSSYPLGSILSLDQTDLMYNQTSPVPANGSTTAPIQVQWGATLGKPHNSGNSIGVDRFQPLMLPRRGYPVLSLGQLAHVNIATGAVNNNTSMATNGLYSIGVAWANPYIARTETKRSVGGATVRDYTYLLNNVLWDSYHFSGLPAASFDLKNPRSVPFTRLRPYGDIDNTGAVYRTTARSAAARMTLEGGFNINSTSEAAWRALLVSLRTVAFEGLTSARAPVPRTLDPVGARIDNVSTSSATNPAAWAGWIDLTDAEITELAKQIVLEIKRRGPALSLGEFINRKLENSDAGLAGTLQRAIDNTTNLSVGAGGVTTTSNRFGGGGSVSTNYTSGDFADRDHAPKIVHEGAPGWLNQADLLRALGPILRPRSDTFVIRAYGDTLDYVNSTPATPVVKGRAWCEAIVQRLPDYVSSVNGPEVLTGALDATNTSFGRRFVITQFRWLTPQDL